MDIHIIDEQEDELGSLSSSSSGNESTISAASSSSDFLDDATSSPSSSPPPSSSSSSSSSSSDQHLQKIPLYQMSDLMKELPIKRGLSRHFQGKSQSFTSLSNVKCLEDLVKPQARPFRKRLKSCKSYGAGLDRTIKPLSPNGCCSRIISKKPTSSMGKRHHHIGFLGARPPTHPHTSGNLSGQALLFA